MTAPPLKAGPHNAITDVAGVLVGHFERLERNWATGTSVVMVPEGVVAAVDVRGGGPGTRETDLLDPSHLVQRIQAVCLTGGSAYGLAAADGVMTWLGERGFGYPVGKLPHEVVPLVPAAVLYDFPANGWGHRPDSTFGYAATVQARTGPVAMGCVGAATGARAGSLKGGIGTASVVLEDGATVGALVAANPLGEVVDPATGLPWAVGLGLDGEFGLSAPLEAEVLAAQQLPAAEVPKLNTTIGVVATDAELTKAECRRLAVVAHDGLARAVRPAHCMFDGDTFFALATGARELGTGTGPYGPAPDRAAALDRLGSAVADTVSRAVVHAVLAAHSLAGFTAYRDRYPSAFTPR